LWTYSFDVDNNEFALTWQQISPNSTTYPSPRYSASMIKGENGKFYMLGGQTFSDLLGELWEYDVNDNVWTNLDTRKAYPLNVFQCAQYYKNNIITIEVERNIKPQGINIFNLETNTWRHIHADNQPVEVHQNCAVQGKFLYVVPLVKRINLDNVLKNPTPATLAWEEQMEIDPDEERHLLGVYLGFLTQTIDNDIYYFGGLRDDLDRNDMQKYNVQSKEFTVVTPDIQSIPPKLSGHSAVQLRNITIVYGGLLENGQVSGDIFYLDTRSGNWSKPEVNGEIPPARYTHTAIIRGEVMYVFGGQDQERAYNDVWMYMYQRKRWAQIGTTPDPFEGEPSQRLLHSAVNNKTHMIIYGGKNINTGFLTDIWSLNLKTFQWQQIYAPPLEDTSARSVSPVTIGIAPDIGSGCAMAVVEDHYILLGACGDQNLQNETDGSNIGSYFWLFNLTSATWIAKFEGPDTTFREDETIGNFGTSKFFPFNGFILMYVGGNNSLMEVHLDIDNLELTFNSPSFNSYNVAPRQQFSATYYGNAVTVFGDVPPTNQVWQFQSSPVCDTDSNGRCYPCTPGTVATNQVCNACQLGQYQDGYGQTVCKKCPVGSFGTTVGANSPDLCLLCKPGYSSSVNGSTQCFKCVETATSFCPLGSVTPVPTTISLVNYERAEYYDPITE
jgi:hypothetical protein